jgi:hypothetical protein
MQLSSLIRTFGRSASAYASSTAAAAASVAALKSNVALQAPTHAPTRAASSHAENTNTFIKEALNHLEYPEKLQRMLLTPMREMTVELVVTMDNGEIEARPDMLDLACCAVDRHCQPYRRRRSSTHTVSNTITAGARLKAVCDTTHKWTWTT